MKKFQIIIMLLVLSIASISFGFGFGPMGSDLNKEPMRSTMILILTSSDNQPITYGNVKVDKVRSVYDGDTFRVDIKKWPDIIGKNIPIRIYGIDTPEIKGTKGELHEKALKARDTLRDLLSRGKKIELRNMRRGKYFRIVAEVYIDNKDVAKIMLTKGLAKKYYGGRKPVW